MKITIAVVINTPALTDAPRIPEDTNDNTEVVDVYSRI